MMRRLLVAVSLLLLSGCGQVDPVLVAVSMPDCVLSGASTMEEGTVRVSLALNGIADAAVEVVEIPDGRQFDELAQRVSEEIIPVWAEPLAVVELSTADGIEGAVETLHLDPGTYALICVDHPDDGSKPLGVHELTVEPG